MARVERHVDYRLFSQESECELLPDTTYPHKKVWNLAPGVYIEVENSGGCRFWLEIREGFPSCSYELELREIPEWLKIGLPGDISSLVH